MLPATEVPGVIKGKDLKYDDLSKIDVWKEIQYRRNTFMAV